MNIPLDINLYNKVKAYVNTIYKKPSAYRSGAYVRIYKKLGGKYKINKSKFIDDYPLKRWFKEEWSDINPNKNESSYPVYRPTKRITENTPKTVDEISDEQIRKYSKLKQKYKNLKNLPKF